MTRILISFSFMAFLALQPAFAGVELEASNINLPVRIDSSQPPGGFYYPVAAGETADFDVTGPGQIEIWVRRTVDSEEADASPGVVRATGDGVFISEIRLAAGVDSLGKIHGPSGTFPTLPDRQVISVPPGAHVFGLQAPADQAIFVRVEANLEESPAPPPPPSLAGDIDLLDDEPVADSGEPEAQTVDDLFDDTPAISEATTSAPVDSVDDDPYGLDALSLGDDPAPTAPDPAPDLFADDPVAATDDADDIDFSDDDFDDALVSDGLDIGDMSDATDANSLAQPFAMDDATLDDAVEEEPGSSYPSALDGFMAGPRLGFGAPARGDKASFYAGVDLRRNILENMLDLQLSAGWYSIAVDSSFAWQDPYGGATQIDVAYSTSIVPVELSGIYHLPFDLGGIAPYAGGGLGVYFASRLDEGERLGGAAMGWHGFAGVELEAGPGAVVPTLSWTGARRNFGNENAAGDDARESLSTVRMNVAYLYTF